MEVTAKLIVCPPILLSPVVVVARLEERHYSSHCERERGGSDTSLVLKCGAVCYSKINLRVLLLEKSAVGSKLVSSSPVPFFKGMFTKPSFPFWDRNRARAPLLV